MKITVSRQSVCMGDDIDDHTITQDIDTDTTFSALFRVLIKQGYFPNIAGNDVVWVLKCGADDLVSWKTKEDKLYSRFVTEEPSFLNVNRWKDIAAVHFRYYSPPIKRAQEIFKMFDGKKFHIWHEGFMSEYESYCIPETIEDSWRNELQSHGD